MCVCVYVLMRYRRTKKSNETYWTEKANVVKNRKEIVRNSVIISDFRKKMHLTKKI